MSRASRPSAGIFPCDVDVGAGVPVGEPYVKNIVCNRDFPGPAQGKRKHRDLEIGRFGDDAGAQDIWRDIAEFCPVDGNLHFDPTRTSSLPVVLVDSCPFSSAIYFRVSGNVIPIANERSTRCG